jgi:3-oxoacyl-[acyl-carrier protein] reductase
LDLGLKNRVAIVTGSSQGIGKAIACGLTKEGVNVTICARTADTLNATTKEIESLYGTEVLLSPRT